MGTLRQADGTAASAWDKKTPIGVAGSTGEENMALPVGRVARGKEPQRAWGGSVPKGSALAGTGASGATAWIRQEHLM
jgi:hypothetical protein